MMIVMVVDAELRIHTEQRFHGVIISLQTNNNQFIIDSEACPIIYSIDVWKILHEYYVAIDKIKS